MSTVETASVVSSRSSNFGARTNKLNVLSINDDVNQLTTFGNPFAEDEKDETSFALVSSLISKVKNTFTAPPPASASSHGILTSPTLHPPSGSNDPHSTSPVAPRKANGTKNVVSFAARPEKRTFTLRTANPAPPLVSLTPVVSEQPSFSGDHISDGGSIRGRNSPAPNFYGTSGPDISDFAGHGIPGFPMADDAKSIRTVASGRRNASASKVIRRLRGEGLSREYWMDDETCKECYDCKSVFSTWRRKHHCRICGQIFCSRCASNIIKASRFGADGMVRVCNLCLQMLEEESDDDDDDRRSIASVSTSFPTHQGDRPSPYSHFHRPSDPSSLYPIGERGRKSSFDGFDSNSRPGTPTYESTISPWEEAQTPVVHPPFRRGLNQDDRDGIPSNPLESMISASPAGGSRPILTGASPARPPLALHGPSSIAFPGSPSSSDGGKSPQPLRSRFNSYATEYDPGALYSRQRLQSRVEVDLTDPAWRSRRESSGFSQELNAMSMFHLRSMLRQMIAKEGVPYAKEWEESLTKLALRVASQLNLNSRIPGTSIDARWYVKIKKLPGGAPRDSEYVDGAVITKNVAHKQMSRHIRQPRVMLVTFPFDYHRVEGQFMSIDPILAQEREYLKNLTSRVAAHHPHVVLVEGPVSRLALEYLLEKKIAVARSVKSSAIQFVSRMTQSQIVSSMDRLALEPRMGDCARFRIQTFEHALIPGRRKTFMRFEGCSREMGCTIVLRGGDLETLRKIKKVTRFIVFIVRNLKMETYLWKDCVLTMPPLTSDATPSSDRPRVTSTSSVFTISGMNSTPTGYEVPDSALPPYGHLNGLSIDRMPIIGDDDDEDGEDAQRVRVSRKIQESIQLYLTTFISASSILRFPPPYPIRRMKELDDALDIANRNWLAAEAEMLLREEEQRRIVTDIPQATIVPSESGISLLGITGDSGNRQTSSPDSIPEGLPVTGGASTIMHTELPTAPQQTHLGFDTPTSRASTSTSTVSYFDRARSNNSDSSIITSNLSSVGGMDRKLFASSVSIALKDSTSIAAESELKALQSSHREMQRIWEWYLRRNADDFAVEKYQNISLLSVKLPTSKLDLVQPCVPPKLEYIFYYGDGDLTLGQYIEDSCRRGWENHGCEIKSCKGGELAHSQVYIHNETRVLIRLEPFNPNMLSEDEQYPARNPDYITSWSRCRVCGVGTPAIPMTEEACRYSFAKFLELHYYPSDVRLLRLPSLNTCLHNIYLHHIRFFSVNKMTVQFQTDPVKVFEVVFPPLTTHVRPEDLLEFKNRDYQNMYIRNEDYWNSVAARIKQWENYASMTLDTAVSDRNAPPLGAALAELHVRQDQDRMEITELIRRTYAESTPSDTLAIGPVRTAIQNKVVAWDNKFDTLEKSYLSLRNYFATEKDIRRLTGANLKRVYDFINGGPSSVSEAEGKPTEPLPENSQLPTVSSASENDSATDADARSEPAQSEIESKVDVDNRSADLPQANKSDVESDSTIGANPSIAGGESSSNHIPETIDEAKDAVQDITLAKEISNDQTLPVSRLPRRTKQHTTVADLVRQFQDGSPRNLPLSGNGLPVSESEQEIKVPARVRTRSKGPLQDPKRVMTKLSNAAGASRSKLPAPQTDLSKIRPLIIHDTGEDSLDESGHKSRSRVRSRNASPVAHERKIGGLESHPRVEGLKRSATPSKARTVRSNTGLASRERSSSRSLIPTVNVRGTTKKVMLPPGSKVGSIAQRFERISRDTDIANKQYAMMRGKRARPVASSKAKVRIFENIMDAARDDSEDGSEASSEADDEDEGDEDAHRKASADRSSPQNDPSTDAIASQPPALPAITIPSEIDPCSVDLASPIASHPVLDKLGLPSSPGIESTSRPMSPSLDAAVSGGMGSSYTSGHSESEHSIYGPQERQSVINTIVGYSRMSWIRDSVPTFTHLKYPAAPTEHLFEEAPITVREDEPTSIIAFTLGSAGYRAAMARSKINVKVAERPETSGGENDGSVSDSQSWGIISFDSLSDAVNDIKEPPAVTHPVFHFESAGVQISCTVFHAEQFDALRRSCQCEHSIIESLARCMKWEATGGKSGSAFLKTRDNRFIAKELTRSELDAMSKFAPKYFEYMSTAISAKRPTVLAKIFGFYKIVYKNADMGKTVRMTLLVMENLFHEHSACQVYDLKGSSRGRLVQTTPLKPDTVLQDENLSQNIHKLPLYVREHAKRILRSALVVDTQFLEGLNVMDYSLIVAVDQKKNEVVVGLVDYIRTYTWDKKLETWAKESTFLKGEPTIVTPKQYRTRFLHAMERYFFLVPDRWMKEKYVADADTDW